MPAVDLTLSCPIYDSFRVQQVAGMFDVPLAERAAQQLQADLPGVDEDWEIGLIVGPSGSGKTSVAKHAFGPWLAAAASWPQDRAVVDCFGDLSIKQVTGLLMAVGFSSPPAWIKPYHVLSGGERFRCDMARTLAGALVKDVSEFATGGPVPSKERPLVVVDEFTSVVDRRSAQMGAAALAKAIHSGKILCRLVAITCHDDVAAWLEPDWVLDMGTGALDRRRLRRSPITLSIHRCRHAAWAMFARHHYFEPDQMRQSWIPSVHALSGITDEEFWTTAEPTLLAAGRPAQSESGSHCLHRPRESSDTGYPLRPS